MTGVVLVVGDGPEEGEPDGDVTVGDGETEGEGDGVDVGLVVEAGGFGVVGMVVEVGGGVVVGAVGEASAATTVMPSFMPAWQWPSMGHRKYIGPGVAREMAVFPPV